MAERQAAKLLSLLGMSEAPVDVSQVNDLPRIEVRVDSRLARLGISGLSESSRGYWRITINRADAITRRRFTLAHEFKHVLDHPFVRTERYSKPHVIEKKKSPRAASYTSL